MFDAERAYAYTAQLAFPRRTGSEGERRAAGLIAEEFRAAGLAVEEQPFRFSPFPLTVAARLLLLGLGGLVLFSAELFPHTPRGALLPLAGAVLLVLWSSRWTPLTERLYDLPGSWQGRNIIARTPAASISGGQGPPGADLIFLAHYDSKSQLQPLALRLGLFLVCLLGLGMLTGLVALAAGGPWPGIITPRGVGILSGLVLMALLLLQANYSHNLSPGALDNASGVGVLLELARCAPKVAPPGLNLVFVATGAEEEGLAGALRFIQAYGATFDPARSGFVNLDGPGAEGQVVVVDRYGLPPQPTGPGLTQALLQLAAERGLAAATGFLPPGAGTDQIPIAGRGFEAVTLQSVRFGRAWLSVHSRADTLSHISPEALRQVGELCLDLVRSWGTFRPGATLTPDVNPRQAGPER